jgi:hypothetical protein
MIAQKKGQRTPEERQGSPIAYKLMRRSLDARTPYCCDVDQLEWVVLSDQSIRYVAILELTQRYEVSKYGTFIPDSYAAAVLERYWTDGQGKHTSLLARLLDTVGYIVLFNRDDTSNLLVYPLTTGGVWLEDYFPQGWARLNVSQYEQFLLWLARYYGNKPYSVK